MDVRRIDPRDTELEVDDPVYRVYFWEQQAAPAGVRIEDAGLVSDEYELIGASSVVEALHWARTNAASRSFVLHIVIDKTLIRLLGDDPARRG